jgi:WD40 repeat protein
MDISTTMHAERDPDGDQENLDEHDEPMPQPLHTLEGHTALVYRVVSIPDSHFFVSGSHDGSCRLWDAEDGREVGEMVHGEMVNAIVVSRDGKTMASGGGDGRIVMWRLEKRREDHRVGHGNRPGVVPCHVARLTNTCQWT